LVLNEHFPQWRKLSIHESSPSQRGISVLVAKEACHYIATQFLPGEKLGQTIRGVRNENLEEQTFPSESFDIVLSLDVMEHVYNPDRAFQEVYRTLRPGGAYICTFPVRKHQTNAWERRFEKNDDGSLRHLKEPEIHGNPIDAAGSIVTIDYGYDLHLTIPNWAPFDVRIYRFADLYHGIVGEYTEVILASKRDRIRAGRMELTSSTSWFGRLSSIW